MILLPAAGKGGQGPVASPRIVASRRTRAYKQHMRILFIGHTRIGDAVLSTGILQALADERDGARVTVACGVAAATLFAPAPFVERVIPIVKRRYAGHWFAVWRQVVGTHWDLVVDLRHSAIPWLVRARQRLIRHGRDGADEHRVVGLARVLGRRDDPPSPHLWSTADQRAAAARLIGEGGPVLAVGPTANWRGKIWPAERFAALADTLTGPEADGPLRGARVAVFGGPGEHELARPVLDAIPDERRIDLVGAADLPTIHACLARCALFVGNDSGLMHIAAASGIPTVGLFGPSRPEHYGPWGNRAEAVRTRLPFEALVGGPGYDHRTTDTLMASLELDDVVAAVRRLLAVPAGEAVS
jgi:heptosyltransferase-3